MSSPLPSVSPYTAGLRCRCPRCGEGRLFAGYLTLAPRCERCNLDFSFADAGDGPAVFVILIAGFIVVGSALVVEATWRPPYWLHAVLWLPLLLDPDARAPASAQGVAGRSAIPPQGGRGTSGQGHVVSTVSRSVAPGRDFFRARNCGPAWPRVLAARAPRLEGRTHRADRSAYERAGRGDSIGRRLEECERRPGRVSSCHRARRLPA